MLKTNKALVLGRGLSARSAEELLHARGFSVDLVEGYDIVIASPGIMVRSELQIGCEALRENGARLLAVTGSKGKSSVVKLVADALSRAGFNAVACGNYGLAVSSVKKCDWAVVEVSSFQLETTFLPKDAFRAATILNLQEDHLDRHESKEIYHALKRKLLLMSEVFFDYSADNANEEQKDDSLFAGSYFDNEILKTNARAAISLLRVAGVNDDVIRDAFKNFIPLPHRMNEVGVFKGIRCINDSKATSIAALGAAVKISGENIRLIAGGLPKGDDALSVANLLKEKVKKVYLIGESAEAFAKCWRAYVQCEICLTLQNAVDKAFADATLGETILFSPGAASYDQFKNFEERGNLFEELVKNY